MLFDEFDRAVFSGGQVIFQHGDAGDCAYLIEEGQVEVLVQRQDEVHRVKLIGKGEMFGEVALIDYQPRTATIRAIERTVLIPISRGLMESLLERSDPVLRHLLLIILERFRNNELLPTANSIPLTPEQARQRAVLQGEATRKLSLAHGMKRALTRQEFQLYYQPICRLTGGNIVGFEALIRWHHPVDGLIPPNDFLWIAEQTSLIHDVGLWVLERACQDWRLLRQFVKHDRPFFSVNLSVAQLNNEQLAEDVKFILDRHGVEPSELKLELTETIMVTHPESALGVMQRLVAQGCGLALDDYGAGYSGLTNVQLYPLETLKIDRAFIAPLLTSAQSLEIVRSSVALAHSLGMDVVAEGIENDEVCAKLIELGCDFGQGWLFDKPASMSELVARYGVS
jgi:EAL domain-containing protein (putative c-di-GMP-specific phosphodiesterase class I)